MYAMSIIGTCSNSKSIIEIIIFSEKDTAYLRPFSALTLEQREYHNAYENCRDRIHHQKPKSSRLLGVISLGFQRCGDSLSLIYYFNDAGPRNIK